MKRAQINVPLLVRIKAGALERLGLYLARSCLTPAALFHSEGLLQSILDTARQSLRDHGIALAVLHQVKEASVEEAVHLLTAVPSSCKALIGVGGGKALDVAKCTASLAGLPYFAAPTSLSNDGFCSPQASLTVEGERRSVLTGLRSSCSRYRRLSTGTADALAFWNWRFVLQVHGRFGLEAGLPPAGRSSQ